MRSLLQLISSVPAAATPALFLALLIARSLLIAPVLVLPLPACTDGASPSAPRDTIAPLDTTGGMDSVISYLDPVILCTVEDTRLSEISGIAASRRSDGLYWLHNDSGGEPRLFAIDSSGRTRATVLADGATNRDWEDLASVVLAGESWLYIGDMGDNDRKREFVTVYRLREPEVHPAWRDTALVVAAEAARFRYPDGARDCEALMVDARDGAVILLDKSGTTCGMYRAAWPGDGGDAVLERIAVFRLPFDVSLLRLVTGADLHPSGTRAALRTYGTVLEYQIKTSVSLSSLFDSAAAHVIMTPGLAQAEAVCYSRDGRDILTTTEGMNPPVLAIRRRR